jgi:hypothetical protein
MVMDGFVYGLDPASKADWFGIVIHQLPKFVEQGHCYYCDTQTMFENRCTECRRRWPANANLPRLKILKDLSGLNSYTDVIDLLRDLFQRYPPSYIVTDYTNEKTLTDILRKDFGDDMLEPINFTLPNKQMLKEDSLALIKMGYTWPNPDHLKDQENATMVRNLVNQLLQEQVITTRSGKITFDAPKGAHNDLAIAWELSVHGCLKFILRRVTPGPAAVAVLTSDELMKKTRRIALNPEALLADILNDPNNQLLGIASDMP